MTHATQYGTALNVQNVKTLMPFAAGLLEHIDAMCTESLTLKTTPPGFVHAENQAFSYSANPISKGENDLSLPKESSHTTYQTEDFGKNSSYTSLTHADFVKKQMSHS